VTMETPAGFFLVPPWEHQRLTFEKAKQAPDYALLFEAGAGKTRVAIDLLRWKCAVHKRVLRTIVLCPVVVCENWVREFKKNSRIGDTVRVLKGSGKKRLEIFHKFKDTGAVFVTNFEAMTMKPLLDALMAWQPEALIADESQRLKNPSSKRAKAIFQLAEGTLYRWILSGTPILNSPMDIFQQYKILDRGDTFGRNFFGFRAKYFFDKNVGMPAQKYFPDWCVRAGALEELNGLVYRKATRVLKADCLDLPPLVREEIEVEMSAEQARAYAEMKANFIAFLRSKVATAQLAITKGLRLQQIVSGFFRAEDGTELVFDCPRLDALKDLLEDLAPANKVIVWAVFKANYAAIRQVCEKLGLGFTELHGEVTGRQRQENIDRFQDDSACRVMIANQGAGGVGCNLTAASHSIYYSRNFSLEHDLQSEARNYRGGSERHVKITRIDLVTPDTIDATVLKALADKVSISEAILQWSDRV
jgi:SNF2 family DNA or RNA helicase